MRLRRADKTQNLQNKDVHKRLSRHCFGDEMGVFIRKSEIWALGLIQKY